MSDELFYKDPLTNEFKPAKRASDTLQMAVLKLNKEREDIKREVEASAKLIEARFAMFETLLKERLNHTCDEIDTLRTGNIEASKILKRDFDMYARTLVDKQKSINNKIIQDIKELKTDVINYGDRLHLLEDKPIVEAASRWRNVILTLAGLVSGILLTQLKTIIEYLISLL